MENKMIGTVVTFKMSGDKENNGRIMGIVRVPFCYGTEDYSGYVVEDNFVIIDSDEDIHIVNPTKLLKRIQNELPFYRHGLPSYIPGPPQPPNDRKIKEGQDPEKPESLKNL